MELVANPDKYDRALHYGAAKYIKNFDKKTGKLRKDALVPAFDHEKLAEEAKYDGYYSIVTSELQMADKEIVSIYRGLGKSRRHSGSQRAIWRRAQFTYTGRSA